MHDDYELEEGFLRSDSIAYFVNDNINEIEYVSLLLKYDMNYFIKLRNGIISDNRLKNKLPTKNELSTYIKNNGLERKFKNMDLDDAINVIFLHKLNKEEIKKSMDDLIIGLDKNNILEKLYAYDAEYIASHHVSHFDYIDYEPIVDSITDLYNNFKNFLILNLKSNLATFIEEYYKTADGSAFIDSCNKNSLDGKLQESDFNEFVSIINKASLLEPIIKNEDNSYIYKLPDYNELGGFFVLPENKLKFILNIMENIDEKFEKPRCLSNIAIGSLIHEAIMKEITKEANQLNLTIENYWNTHVNNTNDNKKNLIKNILTKNKHNFNIENSYRMTNTFEYKFDAQEIVVNKQYISRFIKKIGKLKAKNKSLSNSINSSFVIKHVTSCKKQVDSKFDDLEKMEKMRAILTIYPSQFNDFYIARQECTEEIEYIYTTLIDKRCFNSTINQNELNDNNFLRTMKNEIITKFVTGKKSAIQRNLKLLSLQDSYNLENYLNCLIMTDKDDDLEHTINERLFDIGLTISATDFLNAVNLIRKHSSTGHSYDYSWSGLTQILPFRLKLIHQCKLRKLYENLLIKQNEINENYNKLLVISNEINFLCNESDKKQDNIIEELKEKYAIFTKIKETNLLLEEEVNSIRTDIDSLKKIRKL
jgi:hypothetical protein